MYKNYTKKKFPHSLFPQSSTDCLGEMSMEIAGLFRGDVIWWEGHISVA